MSGSLRLDPIACDGHGLCAELFPEWIRNDDWGYPIIDPRPVPGGLEQHARQAIAACPKLALAWAKSEEGTERRRPAAQRSRS